MIVEINLSPEAQQCYAEDGGFPRYQTSGSSGFDLRTLDPILLEFREIRAIRTGLQFRIPQGYEIQLRSRSSMAARGLVVANQPATIDSDYRGEVKVILINLGYSRAIIIRGASICQGVLCPVVCAEWEPAVIAEDETKRGASGFGSTDAQTKS